jgi:hypothetical protein
MAGNADFSKTSDTKFLAFLMSNAEAIVEEMLIYGELNRK